LSSDTFTLAFVAGAGTSNCVTTELSDRRISTRYVHTPDPVVGAPGSLPALHTTFGVRELLGPTLSTVGALGATVS